jgi:hypothetical protein
VNFQQVKWVVTDLNDLTWPVAQYRGWLIALATVAGAAGPLVRAARKRLPRPVPSLVIRNGAFALALSSAAVAICSLLHFSDLRWLPPAQRWGLHLSALGGVFGHLTDPAVNILNSVSGLPAEWRAAQIAVHAAIVCALLAVLAFVVVVVTRRRARLGEIRQIVQEELRRPAGSSRLCEVEWPTHRANPVLAS